MGGQLPARRDHRLDVRFVEVRAFGLEVEDARPAVLPQRRQGEGELGPVAVVEGEDDRLRRQLAVVVPGFLDLFERHRLVALFFEPVHLLAEVGAADEEFGVGLAFRRRRRARGTRGSAPGRCGVPSRPAGSRWGPCRRLRLRRPSPAPLRAAAALAGGRRLLAPSARSLVPPLVRAGDRDDATTATTTTIERPRATSRRRMIWPRARPAARAARSAAASPAAPSSSVQSLGIRVARSSYGGIDDEPRMTSRSRNSPRRSHAAYPELAAVAAAAPDPGLPGRRRRARPAAGPRPRRHRPGGRGRPGGAGGGARGRAGGRARALRHAEGRARRPGGRPRRARDARATRSRGRCRRSRSARRSAPTWRAATSPSTRWRSRSPTRRDLIDPYDGQADLEAGLLRVIHAAPSSTTRPGRSAPPATRPASASRSSRRPRSCCGRPTSATVTAERRGELRGWRPKRAAPRGFELLAGWGLVEPRPGRRELARRRCRRLLDAPPGGEEASARRGDPRRGASARPAARSSWPRARPAPLRGRRRWPRGRDPVELVLARAPGATWLDDWLPGARSRSRSPAPT